ncbi:MAG: VOC family protein [Acidobacteriota bacterium]|nr:VOC family protein [Acidobacteriota bacterium]
MPAHEKINYLEFPVTDMDGSKRFFSQVFGWEFVDYGPDYASFKNAGLNGGFVRSTLSAHSTTGSALTVFYSHSLEATQAKIEEAGGKLIKPIYAFPGGRRFHFTDPSGNEFAVWSHPE